MSTDIRALMRSLAEDAPAFDNRIALADKAFAAGRRRRQVRRALVSAASAVVALLLLATTLFVGPSPLAAQYGTSGGTKVTGHPSHIGLQFPVLDLPAKPGPIAGVLTDGTTTWAVSPAGHRWRIAGDGGGSGYPTAISPDGRFIAYLHNGVGPLLIHDLVSGNIVTAPEVGDNQGGTGARFRLWGQYPSPHFSSDDGLLAIAGFDAKRTGGSGSGSIVVVSTRTGKVLGAATANVSLSGWTGDRIVTSARAVETRTVDGKVVAQARMKPVAPLGSAVQNGGNAVVSTDGTEWIYLAGGDSPAAVTRFDLVSGDQLGGATPVPPGTEFCGFAAGANVVFTRIDGAAVITVSTGGRVRTAATIDTALRGVCGSWASDAFDGSGHGGLVLDRLTGAFLVWWQWLAWISGALLVLALVIWRVRVHAREFAASYPRFAREPITTRRKRALMAGTISCVLALLGVLTPYVLLPLGISDLRTGQPLVLWSLADASTAKSGGAEGMPALVIVSRTPQQGFAVLVENHSAFDETVADPDPAGPGAAAGLDNLTVATSPGTVEQVRSLSYRPSGVIPAHQARWVRDLSSFCVVGGGFAAQGAIQLSVKVGWITRIETLPLPTVVKTVGAAHVCR